MGSTSSQLSNADARTVDAGYEPSTVASYADGYASSGEAGWTGEPGRRRDGRDWWWDGRNRGRHGRDGWYGWTWRGGDTTGYDGTTSEQPDGAAEYVVATTAVSTTAGSASWLGVEEEEGGCTDAQMWSVADLYLFSPTLTESHVLVVSRVAPTHPTRCLIPLAPCFRPTRAIALVRLAAPPFPSTPNVPPASSLTSRRRPVPATSDGGPTARRPASRTSRLYPRPTYSSTTP